ncbi:MAG: hypothetical protein JWQ81_8369 [Amycolatopsis sp.]|nr:hypothetical protein [Amycolatopsis sp.]
MTVAISVSSGLSALVLVLALVLPSISSPTVPFGVRIPAQRACNAAMSHSAYPQRVRTPIQVQVPGARH